MLEAAFFYLDWIPGDVLFLRLDVLAGKVRNPHAVSGHHRNFAVAEEKNIARVFQNRRDIRSHKVLALAEADHHRRALTRGNNRVGRVRGKHRKRENAAELRHGLTDGVLKISAGLQMLFD